MRESYKSTRMFAILILLSLGLSACRPVPGAVETAASPSLQPATATSTIQQPTPISTLRPSTATLVPTATQQPPTPQPPTPTTQPTSPSPILGGPLFSYNGIDFAVAPELAETVRITTTTDALGYTEFSFGEGPCREVGCVTVYPVASYKEEILFGADIIDGLQSAIATQSDRYFPVLMAHILLRAQTQHMRFANGAGIRAVVMKGQNTVFASNESIVYEFHGLTDDGQYYVAITFPIDASILLSTLDPSENTNAAAIPVPELPTDSVQLGATIREYNQEAQRQLDMLDSAGFMPNLDALDMVVSSLRVMPIVKSPSATGDIGLLDVNIDYRGTWYRKTFSYTREAENIAHFVIVMPESQVDRATADQIFSSIDFERLPDVLTIREDRSEFAWALDYLHEAPGGYFRSQFEPGTYYVAAAFVAAPLSKEEAGVPDDTILYAGMTGGGASTDYWKIKITPGENAIVVSLTDKDGWACPWLYVYDGRTFERRTEILRNVRGKQNERTEVSPIGQVEVVDGAITLRIAEEKDELTFIDEFYILVDGVKVQAEGNSDAAASVVAKDGDYLTLAKGESQEFRFRLPKTFAARQRVAVSVVVSGFYVPLD